MSATIIKSQVVRELASIVVAMAAISGGRGSLGFTQFSGRNGSNACPWIVAKIAAQHLQGNRSVRSLCDAALLREIFDESNGICDSKGGRDACAKTVTMDLFAAKSLLPIVVNDVICLTRQDLVRHMCREVPPWVLIVIGQKRSSCGELEVNFSGIHDTFIIAASVCDVGSIDSHKVEVIFHRSEMIEAQTVEQNMTVCFLLFVLLNKTLARTLPRRICLDCRMMPCSVFQSARSSLGIDHG